MQDLLSRIIQDDRSNFYKVVLGVWAMVAVYAMAHDQYIVQIAPKHFSEYHSEILGIQNLQLLALVHAFGASFSPGLLLGTALFFVTRAGPQPKLKIRKIYIGTLVVIGITELISASSGLIVYMTGQPLYPESWYPEQSLPIWITQTIQLTCYATSALFSAMLLLYFYRFRGELSSSDFS
jgi:hypothetical protein